MTLCYSELSVNLSRVSHHLTSTLVPLCFSHARPFTIAQPKNLDTPVLLPDSAMSHSLRHIWNATSFRMLSLIFDLCKESIFPSFVLWRHKGDHIFSLSWHLYICFYLHYIKASLSHPLGCKLFWLGIVF